MSEHAIKPYARLLTMLGEQLIKNERIALIELIKNSYDADAKWVKIIFENFGENYQITDHSKIIIEDSGIGMTDSTIKKHWLNPATPEKKNRKLTKETTKKGRIIQGEKGIGRFAILKLGRKIKVITKTLDDSQEHIVNYDFTAYDDEFLSKDGVAKDIFLEELKVKVTSRVPSHYVKRPILLGLKSISQPEHGTRIEISNLKGSWNQNKVADVYRDISRLRSIFVEKPEPVKNSFDIYIYKNDQKQDFEAEYREKLDLLLNERSVIRVENGVFDEKSNSFRFDLNDAPVELNLHDPLIAGLSIFRKRYGDAGKALLTRKLECGPFKFGFYIFDFSSKAPPKHRLDKKEKDYLRDHRIYLYRDGIRVYPYGEPDDDWLKIDVFRGTISAGMFLSNDQVVGYVNISQKNNPKLKDKTNREGLIEEGEAAQDFIALIQTILQYIRQGPYARYQIDLQSKEDQDIFKKGRVQTSFEKLKESVGENKKAKELVEKVEKEYKTERNYLTRRAETTEELAGVGLSVETASHDIMGIMSKVFGNLDGLIRDLISNPDIEIDVLIKELQSIRGGLSFIEAQLKDIQLLFRSAKQRRKNIKVKEVIEKVERIYNRLLKKEGIIFDIQEIGSPLVAKTTDAVLLQLFLNLFDNAVYWLSQVAIKEKKILITLDGNKCRLIFSDNGPGINSDDAPYIFEPFYTGKGEEGRGLGLYIAKQLLERNDYSIELSEIKKDKLLSGANFIVNFFAEDE